MIRENRLLPLFLLTVILTIGEAASGKKFAMIIVDGSSPMADQSSIKLFDDCLKIGGKVLVWGVSPESIAKLNRLLPYKLELSERKATSFVKKESDLMIRNLDNKDFYFSEIIKQPVMNRGLRGEIVQKGKNG